MKKTIRKIISLALVCVLAIAAFAGCGNSKENITVYSRESGSGTRSAFIELVGIMEKDSEGKSIDKTIATADVTNSTQVMMTQVSSNKFGIGYISLGTLNDTVKALKIDGAAATVENIKNDSYKIKRPFNILTKGETTNAVAKDFINYIMSKEGQEVISNKGYIMAKENTAEFDGKKPSGKIVVGGSSSVFPVMEKLVESYLKINSNAQIELQQSDSTSGVNNVKEGLYDIGMASRDLKTAEIESGVKNIVIAIDGIAVIVNKENSIDGLTKTQIKEIYTGKISSWTELSK
ncbi:MAG: substrate-binding domain-containing protein [Clostridia bacterium]